MFALTRRRFIGSMITAVAAPALLSNILRAQDGPFVIHKADFELRIKSSWLTERILSSLSIEVIPRFPSVGYNTNLLERLRAAQVLEANDASRRRLSPVFFFFFF